MGACVVEDCGSTQYAACEERCLVSAITPCCDTTSRLNHFHPSFDSKGWRNSVGLAIASLDALKTQRRFKGRCMAKVHHFRSRIAVPARNRLNFASADRVKRPTFAL